MFLNEYTYIYIRFPPKIAGVRSHELIDIAAL
jgi:hypothetical protein